VDGDDRVGRLTDVFGRHAEAVLRFARRRLDDEAAAWDVVSDTFLTAWRHADGCPQISDEQLPWLYAIAGNAVRTHQRGRARHDALTRRIEAAAREGEMPDPAEQVAAIDAITSAMGALSPIDQEVLRLIGWEHLPDARSVGVALGIGTSAAAVRIHRARRRLSRELSRQNPDVSDPVVAFSATAPARTLGGQP
jgi:RNA polymerase sigma-70 factor (ECF subfamily)